MRRANNPAVIPRNHRVEAALAAAVEDNDLGVMERLPDVLQSSFDHERVAATSEYRNPRPQAALYIAPFAGPEP